MTDLTKVRDLMDRDFVRLKADMNISDAIHILIENRVTGATVVDDEDHIVGVDSGRPVVRLDDLVVVFRYMMNDPEGRPPVDLHKEIISQLGSPLTVMTRVDQPYTDPKASRTSVALGVRDPAVLDTALGRIHQAISAGNKDLRRELLGTNIYILNFGPMFGMMMGGMPSDEPESENPSLDDSAMALAVTGSNLVIGRILSVAQAIRDQRSTDLESIQTDSMYSHASRFLPAQAGAWGYENYQTAAELVWVQLKDAASKAAEGPDDEDEEG